MSWDKFSQIYRWEMEFANPNQLQDEKFWFELAKETGGPILDIAAGDGRITKSLLKTGFQVTALELSKKMIEKLQLINDENLTIVNADMKNFNLETRFNLIVVGYFSFQQILNLEEQIQFLKNIKKHLTKNGILGIDIYPCVCEGNDESQMKMIYKRKYENNIVEMYSSYKIDRLDLIKYWKDFYRITSLSTKESIEFYNEIALKECSPDYMNLLFAKADLKIVAKYGSFNKDVVTQNSENIIYLLK